MGYNDVENANLEMTYMSSEYMDGYSRAFAEPVEEPIPDDDYDKIVADIHKVREDHWKHLWVLPMDAADEDFLDLDLVAETDKEIRWGADKIADTFYQIKDLLHDMQGDYPDDKCADMLRMYAEICAYRREMLGIVKEIEQLVVQMAEINRG